MPDTTFVKSVEKEKIFEDPLDKDEEYQLEADDEEYYLEAAEADGERNPTLYIGLGGTGIATINELKRIFKLNNNGVVPPGIAFLGIDSDQREVASSKIAKSNVEVFTYSVKNPNLFYKNSKDSGKYKWVTQSYIPDKGFLGAAQYRQVSRLFFFKHRNKIYQKISETINAILPATASQTTGTKQCDVYVINSLCGGAGSGMFLDIAANIKEYAANIGSFDLTLFGVLVSGDVYQRFLNLDSHKRLLANTYSCLKDLQYFQNTSSQEIQFDYSDASITAKPLLFDLVLFVQGANVTGNPTIQSAKQLRDFLANSIYLMSATPVSKDNRRSMWINPSSPYQFTLKNFEGAPRFLSSIGYLKIKYPNQEILGLMNSHYGEKLLSFFLESTIPNMGFLEAHFGITEKNMSKKIKEINTIDYIKKMAKLEIDRGLEYEDYVKSFFDSINNVNVDEVTKLLENIVENEDWESIGIKVDELEDVKNKEIIELVNDLKRQKDKFISDFVQKLESFPSKFSQEGIAQKDLITFLSILITELDNEETNAIKELNKINNLLDATSKDKFIEKEEVKAMINDKPFWRPKSKLLIEVEEFAVKFAEELRYKILREVFSTVIELYRELDSSINEHSERIKKIIVKLEKIKNRYLSYKGIYKKRLMRLIGGKSQFDNHLEFSIVNTDYIEKKITQMEGDQKYHEKIRHLFASDKTLFWNFYKIYSEDDIFEFLQNDISDFIEKYKKENLSEVFNEVGIKAKDYITNDVQKYKNLCQAQWNYADNYEFEIKGTPTIGLPEDLRDLIPDSPPSIDPLEIDVFKIDYAAPVQAIKQIKTWSNNYRLENNSSENPNSIHNITGATLWKEADTFPSKEDSLILFSLGLALGTIVKPTDEESTEIKRINKNEYGNYISRLGQKYYLMPYYDSPKHLKDKVISLGQGRANAYQVFRMNKQYSKIIMDWFENRTLALGLNKVVEYLERYMNDYLKDDINSSEISLNEQANAEWLALKKYIDEIKNNKSVYLP